MGGTTCVADTVAAVPDVSVVDIVDVGAARKAERATPVVVAETDCVTVVTG